MELPMNSNGLGQQYCLKWNNHPKNISGVFDRLRSTEQFIDVTLVSADRRSIKCHRLLLSAGSGYLEEILAQNPSDHPTIVLSQISFEELKLLVDFMYAGEVAVEQEHLTKLLDAAKILKIKGLYETGSEDQEDEEGTTEPPNIKSERPGVTSPPPPPLPQMVLPPPPPHRLPVTTPSTAAKVSCPPTGSQKRKRKVNSTDSSASVDSCSVSSSSSSSSSTSSPKSVKTGNHQVTNGDKTQRYGPMFGVSNAYFLTTPPPPPPPPQQPQQEQNKEKIPDIPNLLSQTPVHPATLAAMTLNNPAFISNFTAAAAVAAAAASVGPKTNTTASVIDVNKTSSSSPTTSTSTSPTPSMSPKTTFSTSQLLSSAPVRRYKQYTEDSLQQALKEIMEGQSINRSSMKFNIPARTLRDWMKRLNIKSVFTHNNSNSKDKSGNEEDDTEDNKDHEQQQQQNAANFLGMMNLISKEQLQRENDNIAFPGMQKLTENKGVPKSEESENEEEEEEEEDEEEEEEEEEEIDDDEEEKLKIDESK